MKLGPVTKLDKRKKITSKKLDVDVMLRNCDVIVIFLDFWPVLSSPEAGFQTQNLQKLSSVIVTFRLTKTENRTKKSLTQLSHYCFE